MKTEFAKAIEAGEDVVGKTIICINDESWSGDIAVGDMFTISSSDNGFVYFTDTTGINKEDVNDFEFEHVVDIRKEEEEATYLLLEENKHLKQQIHMLKDDLFNLQMENARLDLAAQRWQMFDCEANRNIADKLLKKLADDAVEIR